jgi:hypothetical protein
MALVLITAASARLHPQATPAPGDQVRVATPAGRVEGTLTAPLDDRVLLRDKSGALHDIAADSVRQLDLKVGQSSNVWRGMAIGAGTGALVSVIAVATTKNCTPPPGQPSCEIDQKAFAAGAGALLTIGTAAVGAGIGALTHRTRWQRVQPSSMGLGLQISY